MNFKVIRICEGVLAIRSDEKDVREGISLFRIGVINPYGIPRVSGVKYIFTLEILSDNVLCDTAMEKSVLGTNKILGLTDIEGLSSTTFEAKDGKDLRVKLLKILGFVDPLPSRYKKGMVQERINEIFKFLNKKGIEVKEYDSVYSASIEQLLFSEEKLDSPLLQECNEDLWED